MLSIKTKFNVQRECFNQFVGLLKETNSHKNLIPKYLCIIKKLDITQEIECKFLKHLGSSNKVETT